MIRYGFNISILRWNIIDSLLLYSRTTGAWFLVCAFLAEILFIVIKKYINRDKIIKAIYLSIFYIPFIIQTNNHFIVVIFRVFVAIGFLALGYYSVNFVKGYDLGFINIFFIIGINGILGVSNKLVGMYGLVFNNKLIYIISSLLGSYSIIFLFKKVYFKINIFEYFGKNSLVVLGTHGVILELIGLAIKINFEGYFSGLVVLAITLILEVFIIEFINKYIPLFIGRRKVNTNLNLEVVS